MHVCGLSASDPRRSNEIARKKWNHSPRFRSPDRCNRCACVAVCTKYATEQQHDLIDQQDFEVKVIEGRNLVIEQVNNNQRKAGHKRFEEHSGQHVEDGASQQHAKHGNDGEAGIGSRCPCSQQAGYDYRFRAEHSRCQAGGLEQRFILSPKNSAIARHGLGEH